MSNKRFQYSAEQMNNAVEAVRTGQSTRGASKSYGVPYSTLANKCTQTIQERKIGRAPTLSTSDEKDLASWAISHAKMGFPVNRMALQYAAQGIVKDKKMDTTFKDGRPGNKWIRNFLKRHPEIFERYAENVTKARAAVTPRQLKNGFCTFTITYSKRKPMTSWRTRPGYLMVMRVAFSPARRLARFWDQRVIKISTKSLQVMTRSQLL